MGVVEFRWSRAVGRVGLGTLRRHVVAACITIRSHMPHAWPIHWSGKINLDYILIIVMI